MMFHGVPLTCINHAAATFHVPAKMIIAVMEIEGGKNGDAIKNKNGTVDLGVMQVNSTWLPKLKSHAVTRINLQFNPCINVEVATWILAKGMIKGSGWQGVGNYHSATLTYNQHYREKVQTVYEGMQRALQEERI